MSDLALPHYPPFDCKAEGKSIRWTKWVSRLKNVFVGYNIDSNKRKKALLLTFGGEDLNDIVDSLPESATTAGSGENCFDKLVTAITEYFNPSTNVEFQKYTFRHMQQSGDNIDSFYNELRQVATTCAFTSADSEIKSQLISGCKSHKVRQKGLSEPTITLVKLLEYARTLEVTEEHAKKIESATKNSVSRVQDQPQRSSQRPRRRQTPANKLTFPECSGNVSLRLGEC